MQSHRCAFSIILACIAALWIVPAAGASSTQRDTEHFPNVPLVTQDGKPVRFFDDLIKGKLVVISFVFTGCSPSSEMETARLREVQQLLGGRMGRDVFFYSISIAPDNDTPEALKRYAEQFRAGPGWLFLTGTNEDIALLRQKLDRRVPAIQNSVKERNSSLIIGNHGAGRWIKASPSENPQILATLLGS